MGGSFSCLLRYSRKPLPLCFLFFFHCSAHQSDGFECHLFVDDYQLHIPNPDLTSLLYLELPTDISTWRVSVISSAQFLNLALPSLLVSILPPHSPSSPASSQSLRTWRFVEPPFAAILSCPSPLVRPCSDLPYEPGVYFCFISVYDLEDT